MPEKEHLGVFHHLNKVHHFTT